MKRIGIVGAGVGGLAAAARLAHKGYAVEVFEKLDRCGGRAHLLEEKGFRFDMGPSFVLMPDFFEEAFVSCGRQLKDYLDLRVLDIGYKIFYPDGDCLTVWRDREKTKAELEQREPGSAAAYERLLRHTGAIYRHIKPLLYQSFSPAAAFNPRYWPLVTRIEPFRTYWQLAKKYFKSEKLCYAFTFEAMFIGVSPFEAPAFYSIITYTDHVQKISHPLGGMYQIPRQFERIARENGAAFHYQTEVRRITRRNGRIVVDAGSSGAEFDRVVVNADYAYSQRALLGRPIPRYRYSCSVYLLYLGLKRKIPGCGHHNLFFSRDLSGNLREIFTDKRIPSDPSFYVHVPTVTDPALAPPGKEIFYILVPVPNLDGDAEPLEQREAQLRQTVFDRINKTLGINLKDEIEVERRFYPEDFTRRYNILYGATFGLAHNLTQSAFFRPGNVDARIPGLYYVGASTQPGGGLPPVIAGSRIVADLIEKGDRS